MNIYEIDGKTAQITVRNLTANEIEEHTLRATKGETLSQIRELRSAAKLSAHTKLAALGLTDDEINALLGA